MQGSQITETPVLNGVRGGSQFSHLKEQIGANENQFSLNNSGRFWQFFLTISD